MIINYSEINNRNFNNQLSIIKKLVIKFENDTFLFFPFAMGHKKSLVRPSAKYSSSLTAIEDVHWREL